MVIITAIETPHMLIFLHLPVLMRKHFRHFLHKELLFHMKSAHMGNMS